MRITEKQLTQLVLEGLQEAANENKNDEDLWGGIKGAAKAGMQAVKGEWGKFKRGVMDKGLNNEYKGQSVGDRFKTAGKHIKTGFKGGDLQQELSSIEQALLKLQNETTFGGVNGQNKVLRSDGEKQALKMLLAAVRRAKGGSIGGVNAAASKRYGEPKSAAPAQQQYQATGSDPLNEAKLDRIIRNSIRRNIM